MSKKKKQTEKILETLGTLNSVENKSLNQVYVNKKINHDLDILRAEYGPEVMRAVIFNIEHPLKEEYLIKVEEIKQKYYKIPYVEVIEENNEVKARYENDLETNDTQQQEYHEDDSYGYKDEDDN